MSKGDVILISFPFTDLSGNKLRPAVVIAESDNDVTVCFITTQIQWHEATDIKLSPTANNGLKKSSLIRTSKIATLDKILAKGLLGQLSFTQIAGLNNKLKIVLQLK